VAVNPAWVLAMAGLPNMGPRLLRALAQAGPGEEVWAELCRGELPEALRATPLRAEAFAGNAVEWAAAARLVDVPAVWQAHREAGVSVAVIGGPGYPVQLAEDPDPPAVLCWRGDLAVLDRPRVAVVGTRRCSRRAFDTARGLGRGLGAAGATVVSGLALGVDGAAHLGALQAKGAPPLGVVASGLDVVYPPKHRALWAQVAEQGLLLSEWPLGARPSRWRFPARNRLIAALAHLVVVVESPAKGGSLYTVDEAEARDVPVAAVPGPVGLRCAEGSNALLVDGAVPVRDAADVLARLGLEAPAASLDPPPRPEVAGDARAALGQLGTEARSFAELVSALGWAPTRVATAVAELEGNGMVARRGPWLERIVCG
jgi:DNA processing protein